MTFDFEYALDIAPLLLSATRITILATIGGMALATVGGLVLAVLRMSNVRLISSAATAVVQFIRTTPLLVQLFFLYYVMPKYGLQFDALSTGIVALGLHYSTYMSETYRSGILSVPRGQWEAATAVNLGQLRIWTRIIIPQAIPPIVPALGNYLVAMFKETPLLATITVQELLGTALAEAARTYRYLEPITLVGLIFLACSVPSALLVNAIERRFVRRPVLQR